MEKHKCKLCSRTFANGRSLGGHMKAHLATLPLPPKPHAPPQPPPPPPLPPSPSPSPSLSSSFSSEQESEEKALIYGLRENPKKSIRLADPEFSFALAAATDTLTATSIVQDRESETESKNTPTRLRSKRARTRAHRPALKKPEPAASSVSDTCTEEDVAMCLMMLSRDKWMRDEEKSKGLREIKANGVRRKQKQKQHQYQCDKCRKTFRSCGALESHKNICFREGNHDKIFECPFCYKVFGSGQALGGHKRSHLLPSSSSSNVNDSERFKDTFIDLNLPAPAEEEDQLSVLSDA